MRKALVLGTAALALAGSAFAAAPASAADTTVTFTAGTTGTTVSILPSAAVVGVPRSSSAGENTPMPSCPGSTAMMPPPTPLLAGIPTR